MIKIQEIVEINFEHTLKTSHKPILIYCYQRDTSLSELVGTVFETIAEKHINFFNIFKMCIQDSKDLFFEYGVMKIPALLMFKNGKLFKKEILVYNNRLKDIISNFLSEEISISSDILNFYDDKNFNREVLKSDIPVLANYWLPNNDLCWSMLRDMEDIYSLFKWKIKIGIVSFKDNNDCVTNFGINQVPTAALFINGYVKDKMIGMRSKRGITNFIKQYVNLGF